MSKTFYWLLPCLLLLTGCGPLMIWVKPGATKSEFVQINAACMLEASRNVAPDYSYSVSPGQSRQTEHCDKKNRCTIEETFVPPSTYRTDNNDSLRNEVARACLYRHGWSEAVVEGD